MGSLVFYWGYKHEGTISWFNIFDEEGRKSQTYYDVQLEWTLVKCDTNGNFISLKEVGNGSILLLKIPENHPSYRLRLSVVSGDIVNSTMTTLNTPYNN